MEEFFALIIHALFWPYEAWKKSREESMLGETEFNRETTRFWWWFAVIAAFIIGLLIFIF